MRRRITFAQRPESPFEFTQAVLTPDALSIKDLDAAREERVTFSFDELPTEIWQVLKQCHQIHIRWATTNPYRSIAPFSSRISPGLHVFFSPIESLSTSSSGEPVCALLKKIFGDGLKCSSVEESFITPPILSTRFASTAAYQFYELVPSLDSLVTYLQQKKFCSRVSAIEEEEEEACYQQIALLESADSIDINYDSISHALTMSAFWASAPTQKGGMKVGWTELVRKHKKGTDQVEVGLLTADKAAEPEDIKMGGVLGVVGSDKELKPTLFSFPSRHHPLSEDATYSVSFPAPTGLHPTMTISVAPEALEPPPRTEGGSCALHAYFTLPSSVFGDKYQLSTTDPLFLDSHNLAALRTVAGETDLEAPDWFTSQWGSNWLFELAQPPAVSERDWNITIPLHLRYLHPSESGYRTASVPWPIVFWACTAEDGTKMSINPFDRVNLGWEGLFGPRTMFYQVHPSPDHGPLVEELDVPVLRLKEDGIFRSNAIELGTVAVILLGFLWVLAKLGSVAQSTGIRRAPQEGRDTKHDKAE